MKDTADPDTASAFPEVRRACLRLRHHLLIMAFGLIVILPVSLSGYLSWRFAGTLHRVTTSLTLQQQSLGMFGMSDPGSSLQTVFRNPAAEETAILRQLVRSKDFQRAIGSRLDLSRVWPAQRPVPYLPPYFDRDASAERQHAFWRNMVSVHVGSRDRIIRISVTASDASEARRLLAAIRAEAENRLNEARALIQWDALSDARTRVNRLRQQNARDRGALLDFRLSNETVDPAVLAGLDSQFAQALRMMLAQEEIRLSEAPPEGAIRGGLMREAETRIAALKAQIRSDPGVVAGPITTAGEISRLMDLYAPLIGQAEMSGLSLRLAEQSLIRLRREIETNRVFLTGVTGGTSNSVKSFPSFLPTVLIVAITCFALWSAMLLIFYAVRDRR